MTGPIHVTRAPDRQAVGLAAAAIFAVVTSGVALVLTVRSPMIDPTETAMTIYGSMMFTFVGVVVLWRRPGHGIGRLAILIGVLFSASATINGALEWWQPSSGFRNVLFGPLKMVYDAADSVSTVLGVAGLILGVVLLITWFPDGRRTSRLGGLIEVALLVGTIVAAVSSMREPILEQIGWSRGLDDVLLALIPIAIVLFIGAWIGSVVDLALRYQRSERIRRLQIRWVLVAAAVTTAAMVSILGLGEWIPGAWFFALGSLGLPVFAVAIAITRYHLYDIDRIVSRSIAYAAVTLLLLLVFGGLILVLQSLISGAVATPGSPLDPRVVAASTLVVAALFNPVRVGVQRIVDRRFHRARYDAERTVAGFAGRLRDELDLPTLTGELRRTTVHAVEPATTDVWLRTSAGRPS